jgi:protein-S-isoprenylcysteine O-methyltransferase Ste14
MALHLAAVVFVSWLLIGGGFASVNAWWGKDWPLALPARRWLLLGCALVYFLRVVVTTFYLLKRKMGWGESVLVGVWVAAIHLFFAFLGGTNPRALGLVDIVAVLLYVLGSFLNTGSELQRKWWKERPENRGRPYTGGLFHYAQHINYFGDELLFTGYALITGSAWALLVPLLMLAAFVFFNIPELDEHLRGHYGAEFEEYTRRTRKFIPFVY